MRQTDRRQTDLVSEPIGYFLPIGIAVALWVTLATIGIKNTALPFALVGIGVVIGGRYYLRDQPEVRRR